MKTRTRIILSIAVLILSITLYQCTKKSTNQDNQTTTNTNTTSHIATKSLKDLGKITLDQGEEGKNKINGKQAKNNDRQIIIYQPTVKYQYQDYGYLKGEVRGKDKETADIYISGKKIKNAKGNFETIAARPKGEKGDKWTVEVQARYPDGQILKTLAQFESGQDSNYIGDDKRTLVSQVKEITTTTTSTLALSGAKLYITPGSVKETKAISVSGLKKEDMAVVSNTMSNVTQGHNGYRFLPDGTTFEKELTIAIEYDKTKIPSGYTAQDIYTYYYNETEKRWIKVERDSIDEERSIVYSRTNHFTDYINGILKTPETSDAMAFTPTSIKDLKAAQPLEGITMMSPPQANNKGTANLSYPISIPAGRHGMQPDLNITYNSAGGNSFLGLGWDMNISSITVETRWGVPYFDPNKESETYLLDGETLVTSYQDPNGEFRLDKPTYRKAWIDRNGQSDPNDTLKQFYPRVEGAFRKIIRYGTTPQNYWWEVTDKSGTKYIYGKIYNGSSVDENSTLKSADYNIAKWYLKEVVDLYGNVVRYNYQLKNSVGHSSNTSITTLGKQKYISNINYTGKYTDQSGTITYLPGKYNIDFQLSTTERGDITISGRYGLKEINAWLLNKINITYDGAMIKDYLFGYKTGEFGKTLLCNIIELDEFSKDQNFSSDILSKLDDKLMDRCDINSDIPFFPFVEHKFEYNTLGGNLYSSEKDETIDTKDDEVIGNILPFLSALKMGPFVGSLDGTVTKAWNLGGGLLLGFDNIITSKSNSIGGNYAYNSSKTQGLVDLVDINGDGYPDKLYKRDNEWSDHEVFYRLRIPGTSNYGSWNKISGIENFLRSESYLNNWGIEGYLGFEKLGGSVGVNWTSGEEETKTYMMDLDGDGIVDIVDIDDKNDETNIYYNRVKDGIGFKTNTENQITISGSCEEEKISTDGYIDESIYKSDSDTIVEIKCKCILDRNEVCIRDTCYEVKTPYTYTEPKLYEPDIDNVRVWKAPYSGVVNITGLAKLSDDYFDLRTEEDSVKLSIQKGSGATYLQSLYLYPSDPIASFNMSVSVTAGEEIYFRMQSLSSRKYDKVVWNPIIEYTSLTNITNPNLDEKDANGLNVYKFNYTDDFLISGEQEIEMPVDGTLQITTSLPTGLTLSEITALIIFKNNNPLGTPYILNNNTTPEYVSTIPIIAGDKFKVVMISSGGQVNWSAIDAKCEMIITNTNSPDFDAIDTLTDPNNPKYNFVYYPAINKSVYSYQRQPSKKISITSAGIYNIESNINFYGTMNNDAKVMMSVKNITSGNTDFYLLNSNNCHCLIKTYNNSHQFTTGDYYIDYYVSNDGSNYINSITSKIAGGDIQSGLYTSYSNETNIKYGKMYRGWGQFGYKNKCSDGTCNCPIDTTLLVLHQYYNSTSMPVNNTDGEFDPMTLNFTGSDFDNPETSNIGQLYNPLESSFFIMLPDFKNKSWQGYGNIVYTQKDVISNYLLGMEEYQTNKEKIVERTSISAGNPNKVKAKKRQNKSFGVSGNVNIPFLDFGGNRTDGKSILLADMFDVNGDGYPDAVSQVKVQYSKPTGGLGNKIYWHSSTNQLDYSESTSIGGNISGSYSINKPVVGNAARMTLSSTSLGFGGDLSGNYCTGSKDATWLDINGDGLPDKLVGDNIYMNLGYKFMMPDKYPIINNIQNNMSWGLGVGLSSSGSIITHAFKMVLDKIKYKNIKAFSVSLGLGGGGSSNTMETAYVDVNGDGLPDKILSDNTVMFNLGDSFSGKMTLPNSIDKSQAYYANLSAAFTFGITFPPFPLKVVANPKGGFSREISLKDIRWIDMDNDGCLDYVVDDGDGKLNVHYSRVGKTNLLKKVHTPALKTYEIDYNLSQSSVECPTRHWEMKSVIINEGVEGKQSHVEYEYKNRKYNRFERDDYGYDEIIAKELDNFGVVYRKNISQYHNENYMFKGIMKYNATFDANDKKLVEVYYNYALHEITTGVPIDPSRSYCFGDGFPAIYGEIQNYYLASTPTPKLTTEKSFIYGKYGNVESFTDLGQASSSNAVTVYMTYKEDLSNYIVGIPMTQVVSDGSNLLRKRQATIGAKGEIQELIYENSNGDVRTKYNYIYDDYGNIEKVTLPQNGSNQTLEINYTYDGDNNTYPIETSNSLGYKSNAVYDYRWGKPTEITDVSLNTIYYTYDAKGRLKNIIAPKEVGTGYNTVEYEYWDQAKYNLKYEKVIKPWAKTINYNPSDPSKPIKIITFADGFGNIIETKKDVDMSGTMKRAIIKTDFDKYSRAIKQYNIFTEDLTSTDTIINKNTTGVSSTLTAYDILDRVTTTTYPDQTTSTQSYEFGNDAFSKNRFKTIITDQNSKVSIVYSDEKGLKTTIKSPLGYETNFKYDAIGQLIESIDPELEKTYYYYDMLGRRISRNHPSAGITDWEYDPAGNLITESHPAMGDNITYNYHYNQLTNINYSDRPWNDVLYEYGTVGSGNNTGKLIIQRDANGSQEFEYGNMGELIKNRHTYVLPNISNPLTLTTEWEYDSWNRVKNITYPDGEYLQYTYNNGGLLSKIEGYKDGSKIPYINNIDYDAYEQRTKVEYGNGVVTNYNYNGVTRRMTTLSTISTQQYNKQLQNITYSYDAVGNISNISNQGNQVINPYNHTYTYDNDYRLITTLGSGTFDYTPISYTYGMTYSPSGKILNKTTSGYGYDNNGPQQISIDNQYNYNTNKPQQLEDLYNQALGESEKFRWDDKGNMIFHQTKHIGERNLCWTEDNRLQGFTDQYNGAYYGYDASGERAYKLTGSTISINQNGTNINVPILQNQTLYASALITLSDKGYTKHYFEEGKRICSKIGNGGLIDINTPANTDISYIDQIGKMTDAVNFTFENCIGATPYISTNDLYPIISLYEHPKITPDEPAYFYHSDHLGSSSYITDDDGDNTQTLAYLPYGEDWVNIINPNLNPKYIAPYKFNGKEKDEESGYHYYGARYYNSNGPFWLSVDPLSDKYPSLTPYNYCANSPIMLIDPDGMQMEDPPTSNSQKLKEGLATAVSVAISDSPAPGPADLVALAIVKETVQETVIKPAVMGGIVYLISKFAKKTNNTKANNTKANDSSKNEKHGDVKAKTKAEKQIKELEKQKEGANKSDRKAIDRKIRNVRENAQRKEKGEEHSRTNKR
ncbi:MAG: repeat-associated core domain protein [Bacteroidetes bacterium]|nr:repeat-associated core domain protein [Bacteroidota bacterium]